MAKVIKNARYIENVNHVHSSYEPDDKSTDETIDNSNVIINESTDTYDSNLTSENILFEQKIENEVNQRLALRIEEEKNNIEILKKEREDIGYDEGYRAGLDIANKESEKEIEHITTLLESLGSSLELVVEEHNSIIKEVIYIAICKVLGESLQGKDNRLALITHVLTTIDCTNPYKIKVSPNDYNILLKDITNKSNISNTIVEADERVEIGGCIVETNKGIFDGRLEVQLAHLKETIENSSVLDK